MEKCHFVGLKPSMSGLQFVTYLASIVFKAHDFMPDLKVDRFMPVVINHTILMFYRQIMESIDRTEADLNIIYRI